MSDATNDAIDGDGPKVVKLGEAGRQVQTFFSAMEHSFVELDSTGEDAIRTEKFLDSCRSLLPVFNVLGATVFAPVKADIQGNIDKLNKQFTTDPAQFTTLLSMVQREVDDGKNATSGFAAEALLWLKRALEFIVHLLREIHSGKESLTDCAGVAYGKTLKPHHNWLVRGIFAVAVRAMPSMKAFQRDLAPTPQDAAHPAYTKQLFADCGQYIVALDAVLETINAFYRKHKLEEVPICVS
ncbi:unnamed protein product [Ixodes hexagonus]